MSTLALDSHLWRVLESALLEVKACVYAEIRAYPKPITACDAQYNYLLEQRTEVGQLLARLESTKAGQPAEFETAAAIGAFFESSSMIDEETKRELLECVRRTHSRCVGHAS